MWLLFDGGFVSVVKHRSIPDRFCVRARVEADLVEFRKLARSRSPIKETPANDYRFRIVVTRKVVQRGVEAVVKRIDYDNFKDRVAESHGLRRAHNYGEVWSTLRQLQGFGGG